MENSKEVPCKPTLENIVRDSNNLISECLEISSIILNELITTDALKQKAEDLNPNCLIADVEMQNQNLKLLKSKLLDIKTTIM